jgi:NADH dehydrogenase
MTQSAQTGSDTTPDVIVVGGGFAGVAAAEKLGKAGIKTLLIDKNSYHQFQPLLYQLATAQIGESAIARPLRSIFKHIPSVRVLREEVSGIDAAKRTVTTADGTTWTAASALVIACGAVPNFFGTPGAEELAYPLYSAKDANRLGNTLADLLDQADADNKPVNVAVVGAGPTGVETAGAIAENFRFVVPGLYSDEFAAKCSVSLVDMLPHPLMPFSEKSQQYATKELESRGVELELGSPVTAVKDDSLAIGDRSIPADLVVWAGGLKAGSLLGEAGLPQGRGGRIDVRSDLTVEGMDGVYVLGDAANITDARGDHLPQLGSVAKQSGAWAARNIEAALAGRPLEAFGYADKGYMAMIGRGSAVAELGRKRYFLGGFPAFMAWLGVHLVLLSGWNQRIRAVSSWLPDYVSHARPHVFIGSHGSK